MQQQNINTIGLIGCIITVLAFGGTLIGVYTDLRSDLNVIKYQVVTIRETQIETSKRVQEMQSRPSK